MPKKRHISQRQRDALARGRAIRRNNIRKQNGRVGGTFPGGEENHFDPMETDQVGLFHTPASGAEVASDRIDFTMASVNPFALTPEDEAIAQRVSDEWRHQEALRLAVDWQGKSCERGFALDRPGGSCVPWRPGRAICTREDGDGGVLTADVGEGHDHASAVSRCEKLLPLGEWRYSGERWVQDEDDIDEFLEEVQ